MKQNTCSNAFKWVAANLAALTPYIFNIIWSELGNFKNIYASEKEMVLKFGLLPKLLSLKKNLH